MFSLKRKQSLLTSDVLSDFVDCHNHILPDIDDGIESVSDAIDILEYYEKIGVKSVIFTPHIKKQFPANNYDSIRGKYDEFISVYREGVQVSLAAEYMLDYDFEKHLASGKLLPLFDEYILLELPEAAPPFDFVNRIKNIMSAGYFVVLAHPERYLYLEKELLWLLKDDGVKFQLNLFSLSGKYGKLIKNRAIYNLKKGAYDLLGSDLHSKRTLEYMEQKCLTREIIKSLSILCNNNLTK